LRSDAGAEDFSPQREECWGKRFASSLPSGCGPAADEKRGENTCQHVLVKHASMYCRYMPACFPKHACMYSRNMPACISNTIWHVLPADGRKQKQAGEGGAITSSRIVDGLLP
jgi:hypothetical protein